MKPVYTTDNVSIYRGDNLELTKQLVNDSVNLTVTSPPYDLLRDYTKEDVWTFAHFQLLATELFRVTTPGGVVIWNTSDQTLNGSESGSSFRQALHFMDCGFLLADTMIYKKTNPGGARGSNKTYIQCFEYMFVLSKGPHSTYNLIKDRPNKRPGRQTGGGKRRRDGKIGSTVLYESEVLGRRFNIWEYPTQTDRFSGQHPAPFPLALAEDHIISWSRPDDLIFDPFCGSGTTPLAALNNGRKAIGVDISEDYVNLTIARLSALPAERHSS